MFVEAAEEAEALLGGLAESLDASLLGGAEASALFAAMERVRRYVESVRLACLAQVVACKQHFEEGCPTPARFVSKVAGCSTREGARLFDTAGRLTSLPGVSSSLRRGEIGPEAAALVSKAASCDQEREQELVSAAASLSYFELERLCRREISSRQQEQDKQDRERRLHENRHLRLWRGRDGSGRGEFSLDAVCYARLVACIDSLTKELVVSAARREEEVGLAALQADALVSLVDRPARDGGGPRSEVVLRVDLEALRRGATEPGETCEIQGVGEVSVSTARSLLGRSFLWLVVSKGRDPACVTRLSRYIDDHQHRALWERDRGCVVCGTTRQVERDHWRVDYADLGPTELDNLALLCAPCHRMKTYRGWRLGGGPGHWTWERPEDFDSSERPTEDDKAA